jgi:hypothetical protein
MKKEIPEIIDTALELDNSLLKEFFELHQKESGFKPEMFFELVWVKIREKRKKINTDFSRIDEEKYPYSIIDSYQVADLAGRMRLAARLIFLEDFLKKQLDLLRQFKFNIDLINPILTPDEGLTSKVVPPIIKADKLDFNDSDDLKSLEKISEGLLKEDLKIDDAITGTKNPDVQDKDSQKPVFENKINRMPIDQVRIFFTPLIETKNKNGDNWMEPEAFEIFIRRSFLEETSLSKPEINLGKGTKGAIVKLFYKFYWHCIGENHTSRREKKPYVKLLRNAFNTGIFDNLNDDSFTEKAIWDWPDFKSKVKP